MRGLPPHWRLAAIAVALGVAVAAVPTPAAADNCGSLSDCWSTIAGGLLAIAAVAAVLGVLPVALPALAGLAAMGGATPGLGPDAPPAGPGDHLPVSPPAQGWGVDPGVAQNVAADPGYLPGVLGQVEAVWVPGASLSPCPSAALQVSGFLATGELSPPGPGVEYSVADIEDMAGASEMPMGGPGDITNLMQSAGTDGQGWVVMDTGRDSHIFNVANINGQTSYIDGQTAIVTGNAQDIANRYGYYGFTGPNVHWSFIPLPSHPGTP